jgi:2,3-bisphosphoglycerate-independent phosphoglycerate mutase
MMFDPETGQPHTAHTLNRVPAMLVNGPADATALADGKLADVAPTLLQVMGLPVPAEMTGRSLIRHARAQAASHTGTERRVGE